MSIRINNKIISGTYTSQSYRYVGEIFQSALPIQDSRVALLDGHKIYESEGYGSFIQYITSLALLYPQLSCTEDEWQLSDTTYGECGKFVINEDSVRLPKIVSFIQGLSSLQDLATLVEAGLPNITGEFHVITDNASFGSGSGSGAFKEGVISSLKVPSNSNSSYQMTKSMTFDALRSNPIYGNSDTVQPQSIRYPYYIVLATGVTQEVKVKEELTTNIPFTLFESKYSEVELNNTSWLLSSGQWNSKELYPSAYNELVKEYNAGSNKYSIKLHTDEYGDYDFVLNLDDETFRLPLKSKLASGKAVVGNGNAMRFTDGTYTGTLALNRYMGSTSYGLMANTDYPEITKVGTAIGDTFTVASKNKAGGLITSGDSGIETSDSDLYLYFYVGDTNINVSLVDTGKLTQEVANLIPNNSDLISGYSMPSSKYIDLTLGASETKYTAPTNGWFCAIAVTTDVHGYIELISETTKLNVLSQYSVKNATVINFLPAKKGDIVVFKYVNCDIASFRFIYAEGEV